jgi:hypothetical protein
MDSIKKTAVTAYGKVGTDFVRMTAALVDGTYVFVRADGSNSIVPELPSVFRTSGDIASVVATVGHRVSMAAVPSVGLPNHTWKGQLTLGAIVDKFAPEKAELIIAGLVASYAQDEAIAA